MGLITCAALQVAPGSPLLRPRRAPAGPRLALTCQRTKRHGQNVPGEEGRAWKPRRVGTWAKHANKRPGGKRAAHRAAVISEGVCLGPEPGVRQCCGGLVVARGRLDSSTASATRAVGPNLSLCCASTSFGLLSAAGDRSLAGGRTRRKSEERGKDIRMTPFPNAHLQACEGAPQRQDEGYLHRG
jgi:hypothetical protein